MEVNNLAWEAHAAKKAETSWVVWANALCSQFIPWNRSFVNLWMVRSLRHTVFWKWRCLKQVLQLSLSSAQPASLNLWLALVSGLVQAGVTAAHPTVTFSKRTRSLCFPSFSFLWVFSRIQSRVQSLQWGDFWFCFLILLLQRQGKGPSEVHLP